MPSFVKTRVALTGHAMAGDWEQALAAGCNGYISKRVDTTTLGDQVREFLAAALEAQAL